MFKYDVWGMILPTAKSRLRAGQKDRAPPTSALQDLSGWRPGRRRCRRREPCGFQVVQGHWFKPTIRWASYLPRGRPEDQRASLQIGRSISSFYPWCVN